MTGGSLNSSHGVLQGPVLIRHRGFEFVTGRVLVRHGGYWDQCFANIARLDPNARFLLVPTPLPPALFFVAVLATPAPLPQVLFSRRCLVVDV